MFGEGAFSHDAKASHQADAVRKQEAVATGNAMRSLQQFLRHAPAEVGPNGSLEGWDDQALVAGLLLSSDPPRSPVLLSILRETVETNPLRCGSSTISAVGGTQRPQPMSSLSSLQH